MNSKDKPSIFIDNKSPPKRTVNKKRLISPRKRPLPGYTGHIPNFDISFGVSKYTQWIENQLELKETTFESPAR